MEDIKVIAGETENELWETVAADLKGGDVLEYAAVLRQAGKEILLDIDIDLGGGFEGGWENTQLKAAVTVADNFRFAIHHEGFLDSVGKFLGMEDVVIGYPELDNALIIKTNDRDRVNQAFADPTVRSVFAGLDDFDCGIHTHTGDDDKKQAYLELNINEGINEAGKLRSIYHAFHSLLIAIDEQPSAV